jgi:glycolate oxidase subunit GlcD
LKSPGIKQALMRVAGQGSVIAGEHIRDYMFDATLAEGLSGRPDAVVAPSSPEAAAAVMEWCYTSGVPLVPRGGGTGYSGGCVAEGGVVISTERLNRVRTIDPLHWCAEVEAGVTTRRVQELARENGLYYPVDPGAAEQSQIGGNVATNAGGPHAFKYGVTRRWVMGLEVIVPPGQKVRLGGAVRKDVAGYDLLSLLVGSEGTLALITSVTLAMLPAVEARFPVVAFYASARDGVEALESAMASGVDPAALEYLDQASLEVTRGSFPANVPDGAAFALIAEADGGVDEATVGREALREALAESALEIYSPTLAADIAAIWRWREGVGLAVDAALGGKMSEDISVPVAKLADAIEGTLEIGHRHEVRACSWGHAGDGNLHSTFMFDRNDAAAVTRAKGAVADLFTMAIELGGTVSGEHGVGVVKGGWLRHQWSEPAVALHEGVKRLFDPQGLLNPGKKLA